MAQESCSPHRVTCLPGEGSQPHFGSTAVYNLTLAASVHTDHFKCPWASESAVQPAMVLDLMPELGALPTL